MESTSDPLQRAFDAWVDHGKPTARYIAHGERDVRAVRALSEEIEPRTVEIVRSFVADRPPFIERVRLLRAAEPSGSVFGWTEFYVLAGEQGRAGRTIPIHVGIGGAGVQDVPICLPVTGCVIPVEHRLDEWSDAQLADFASGVAARLDRDAEAARKNVNTVFHFEDDLVSATVVRRPEDGRYEIRLSFGLVIWPDLHTTYDMAAQIVPPSLRAHLKGEAVVQPDTSYEAADGLVSICRDLVEGRILEFGQPAWEGALMEHEPRRLVRLRLPAGVLAFAVGLDCVDRLSLGEIVEKLKGPARR